MGRPLTYLIAALSLAHSIAYAQIMDLPDPNDAKDETYVVPEIPVHIPAETQTPSSSVIQSRQTGAVVISNISRKTNGDLYQIQLQKAINLTDLEITILKSRLKLHKTELVLQNGNKVTVQGLKGLEVANAGTKLQSERLNSADVVVAIELTAEAYSAEADIRVFASSNSEAPKLVYKAKSQAVVQTPPAPKAPGSAATSRTYISRPFSSQAFTFTSDQMSKVCQKLMFWGEEKSCFQTFSQIFAKNAILNAAAKGCEGTAEHTALCYREVLRIRPFTERFDGQNDAYEKIGGVVCRQSGNKVESPVECLREYLAVGTKSGFSNISNVAKICNETKTWNQEKACIEVYLNNSDSSDEQLARRMIAVVTNDAEQRAKLTAVVINVLTAKHSFLGKLSAMCAESKTWGEDHNCHDYVIYNASSFYSGLPKRKEILTSACSYISSSNEHHSKCLEVAVKNFAPAALKYKATCDAKKTWGETVPCLRALVSQYAK